MNICEQYGTCRNGLLREEAERRLELYGKNLLSRPKPKPLAVRFLLQMKDAMLIILMAAAIVSLVMACFDFSFSALFEPFLIFFIVFANALISSLQERKAEKSLNALESLTAVTCKVRRDGEDVLIDSSLLAPGDLLLLHAGDVVPADCAIIDAHSVSSEESLLTGESIPVHKREGDLLYSGCSILTGRASAIVEKTGDNTEMGRIAALLKSHAERLTPLQDKLKKLSEQLGIISLVICFLVFAVGLFGIYVIGNSELNNMTLFMTAIALAVSALPEGLPTTVTIVLSAGTRRMVAARAIVRKLPAVETLGSVSVICTDKTGTLTEGKMTVTEKISYGGDVVALAAMCTDNATDPTDAAIIQSDSGRTRFSKLSSEPFDNIKRMMSVTVSANGRIMEIVKGAYENVAKLCGDNRAAARAEDMSERGLRVIAVAKREINSPHELKGGRLEFVGLLGLSDPPRAEVKDAIAECRNAGIRPVMLTGDGAGAAKATASQLGLPCDVIISGAQLDKMSDEELALQLAKVSVFARVTPSDKLRIVKAFQAMGEVVGVTGDGVNDAPALKVADIGCAMGSGTDVAKMEADLVLTDNNFTTVVSAVEIGRGIFDNIRKAVAFLLGTNIGEVIAVFAAMCISFDAPLLSMQLLWINLISDSFPAIALGMEKTDPDVMKRRPLKKSEGIFNKGILIRLIFHGTLFGVLCLIAFYVTLGVTGDMAMARTAAFLALSVSQTLHAYNMRSTKPLCVIGAFTNKILNIATLTSLALISIVVFVPPIATAFAMAALPIWAYIMCLGLAILPLIIDESVKLTLRFMRSGAKKKATAT